MDIIVRLANASDLSELMVLNEEFNGVGESQPKKSGWSENSRELVAIAHANGAPAGFACAQSFMSFCYNELQGEITEMYVRETYRRMGIARSMIDCLEKELQIQGVECIKILTGRNNVAAIKTYEAANYIAKNEIVLQKKI